MPELTQILADWPLWGLTTRPIEPQQIKLLDGGLTNVCYQLSLDSGEYILRIAAQNTQALGIDRRIEKSIHQLVAALQFTSPLRYCDDEDRYWIRDYIEGESLFEPVISGSENSANGGSVISDSLLCYMVEQLKALHQLPVDLALPKVNISEKAQAYWQILEDKNPQDEMLKMKPLMQISMSEPPAGDFCLCHLDPVLANWLYTAEGLKLLDWEYAGFAHPMWDLAALYQGIKEGCDLCAIEEAELEQKIIELYGIDDLVAWRRGNMQMEYLSSLWFRAQA